MMDEGASITVRVYAEIGADLAAGRYAPGERFDFGALRVRHKASTTPLREALFWLTGEERVEQYSHMGFRAPPMSDSGLRSAYEWNSWQVRAAIRWAPERAFTGVVSGDWPFPRSFDLEPVDALERLFLVIARLSRNTDCVRGIERMNAKLRPFRLVEPSVIAPGTPDLRELPDVLRNNGVEAAEAAVAAYHELRRQCASEVLDALHAGVGGEGVVRLPSANDTRGSKRGPSLPREDSR